MDLETTRLTYRPWHPDDAEAAFEIYSDPLVLRYLGNPPPKASVEEMRTNILDNLEPRAALLEQGLGVWAVIEKATNRPIGTALYKVRVPSQGCEHLEPSTEIGWHLAQASWGRGFGTEMAQLLLQMSFAREGLARAMAYPENLPSIRIMEKIGLEYVGETNDYYNLHLAVYEARAEESQA